MKKIRKKVLYGHNAKVYEQTLNTWSNIEDTIEKRINVERYRNRETDHFFYNLEVNDEHILFSCNSKEPIVYHNSAFLKTSNKGFLKYDFKQKKLFHKDLSILKHVFVPKRQVTDYLIKYCVTEQERTFLINTLGLDFIRSPKILMLLFDCPKLLEKVLEKKITNEVSLFKFYVSYYKKIKVEKLPIKYFLDLYKAKVNHKDAENRFFKLFKTSENIHKSILNYSHIMSFKDIGDLIDENILLQKKINYSRSHTALKNIHSENTKIITGYKIKHINKSEIYDKVEDKNFSVLNSEEDFFIEGDSLRHCIFSNDYFKEAEKKSGWFYISYRENGERKATAEISIVAEKKSKTKVFINYYLHQFRAKYNHSVDEEKHKLLHAFILKNSHFFIENTKFHNDLKKLKPVFAEAQTDAQKLEFY
ncbi:PcfJ domain-containing protein [Chryseobacterium phosphatilyticum]|nr:PcfJ domain-containing protein [Chryseobacterium phosphatilyticum]